MMLVPANPIQHTEELQDALRVVSNGQVALKRIPFGAHE